ncbi:hypothetical protein [Chroococcidiopsis sp.]|uniref:hypothetical protein n=1 Tax=Chroococcidiopsis sp. TaxID=3088168 RepID=UPI003F3554FB
MREIVDPLNHSSYRSDKGAAPKLQLAIARRRDNFSPIVQQFLHIVEELSQKAGMESVA